MTNKPECRAREFWINDTTGCASEAEESISRGYHVHVIEYSAYQELKDKADKLRERVVEYAENGLIENYNADKNSLSDAVEYYDKSRGENE